MKTQSLKRVPIRANSKIIGEVCGETFYKNVLGSKHFLRVPRAIAFDVSSLNDAENADARFVQVTDAETSRVYRASIATIRAKGFRVARGFGEQIALALEFWNRDAEPLVTQLNFLERVT
ncbi:MAG: hypothetical protein B6D41_11825 [Chloroflexi bacterium UTCFX4]|jgi:hypothetical protein|nr:MAG: hypothetical protein B6D41_11825 [Chloroflexi bacterium UTCFX4]